MTKRERKSQLKNYPQNLRVGDVAEILHICKHTVYQMIRREELPAIKIGGQFYLLKDHIINYLQYGNALCFHPQNAVRTKS